MCFLNIADKLATWRNGCAEDCKQLVLEVRNTQSPNVYHNNLIQPYYYRAFKCLLDTWWILLHTQRGPNEFWFFNGVKKGIQPLCRIRYFISSLYTCFQTVIGSQNIMTPHPFFYECTAKKIQSDMIFIFAESKLRKIFSFFLKTLLVS